MFSANSSQVSDSKLFVEDVFSTYLYTGNGASSQTITTNLDVATKGGLVWQKGRNAVSAHYLFDTTRNDSDYLRTNQTNDVASASGRTLAIGTSGFTVGSDTFVNGSGSTFATWSFKKSPKFFDLVTWTGDGTNRTIAHNLGVAPGCIIVKRLNGFSDWQVYHRSNANTQYQVLNTTAGVATGTTRWNSTTPTATEFTVGTDASVNASGGTYIAYLYAHDTTADSLIQCGTFTTDGSAVANVTLGWEPQWVMVKRTDGVANWIINDNMRGMSQTSFAELFPNTSGAEVSGAGQEIVPNATGFTTGGAANLETNATYIYMAIRRGPMRTPTLGTSVYNANNVTTASYSVGFPSDMALEKRRSETFNFGNGARLMGGGFMSTNTTTAFNSYPVFYWDEATGNFRQITDDPACVWSFRRAPGFFDVVCYTGNGVNGRTINHNLGVTPELIIMKNRTSAGYNWFTWDKSADLSQASALLALSNSAGRPAFSSGNLNSTVPTSTVFTVGGDSTASGQNYVTYLFASCPGVSKVGSYTGNGSSQTINCGFAAGARFVLIKRTDSTGDWYVWDTARGIVAGNDPHLSLNTTAAEVTTDDTIDTDSSGFVVNQVAATNVNVNAATYIFLAIA